MTNRYGKFSKNSKQNAKANRTDIKNFNVYELLRV